MGKLGLQIAKDMQCTVAPEASESSRPAGRCHRWLQFTSSHDLFVYVVDATHDRYSGVHYIHVYLMRASQLLVFT